MLQTGSLVGRMCTFCMWRLRRVRDDRFLLHGSQRNSSAPPAPPPPTPEVFRLPADVLPAALLDAAAILAMAAAAAAATNICDCWTALVALLRPPLPLLQPLPGLLPEFWPC